MSWHGITVYGLFWFAPTHRLHPPNYLIDLFFRACARAPTAHADLSVLLDEGGVQQRTQAAAELAAAVYLRGTRSMFWRQQASPGRPGSAAVVCVSQDVVVCVWIRLRILWVSKYNSALLCWIWAVAAVTVLLYKRSSILSIGQMFTPRPGEAAYLALCLRPPAK